MRKQTVCLVLLGLLLGLSWAEQQTMGLDFQNVDTLLLRSLQSLVEDPTVNLSLPSSFEGIVDSGKSYSHPVIVIRGPEDNINTLLIAGDIAPDEEMLLPAVPLRSKESDQETTVIRMRKAVSGGTIITINVVSAGEQQSLSHLIDAGSIGVKLKAEYEESGNTRDRRDANILLHRSKRGRNTGTHTHTHTHTFEYIVLVGTMSKQASFLSCTIDGSILLA